MTLCLDVRQQFQTCEFKLSWGEGQQLPPVNLSYPTDLIQIYQQWQRSYLQFYRTFRGRVVGVGSFSDVEDRRSQLVKAEAELLANFHEWLRNPKLNEIRQQIAHLAKELSEQVLLKRDLNTHLTIFLTCSPLELERLPWGTWEIGQELGTTTTIRIARSPDRIRARPATQVRRGRNRVLVILGDDTGLDFKRDREAVQGLAKVADIHFTGWQPGLDTTTLLTQVTQAITDQRGWDLLLFAGHSNEAETTGGELAIAPNVALSVGELAPYLEVAKRRGLQFALFNSCSGLDIAKSLIDLGLNQVAVMREPIHNQVAQEFLVQFLHSMAQHKDVHEALLAASQFLRLEKNLTYPSSALIPSLFCRPGQPLFQFRKFGWTQRLQQLAPTKRQAVALSGLAALSLLMPVQGVLLEQRQWTQALYRRVTRQISAPVSPTIALVQIDEASLQAAGISAPYPMDRAYLAQLIERLTQLNAQVVGVDYLFDRPAEQATEDQALARALQQAVSQGTWLVIPSTQHRDGKWATVLPGVSLPSDVSHWSLVADISLFGYRREQGFLPAQLSLLFPGTVESSTPLPFSYLLALTAQLEADATSRPLRPSLQSQSPLINQLVDYVTARGQSFKNFFSPRSQLQPITILSYWLRQTWFHPVVDFSLPPGQVYRPISAWQLLEGSANAQFDFQDQVVILAAGGYDEAGRMPGEDNKALPAALHHWRFWQKPTASLDFMTGGEVHAYMLHHFLTRRFVVPIPDLWMIGAAALLGKCTVLVLQSRALNRRQGYLMLVFSTAAYGVLSLQLYISAALLLPWLLPSVTFWIYVLPLVNSLNPIGKKQFLVYA